MLGDRWQICRHQRSLRGFAAFQRQRPWQRPARERSGKRQRNGKLRRILAENRDRLEPAPPRALFVRRQRRYRVGVGRRGNTHRREQRPLRFCRRDVPLSVHVEIFRKDAGRRGETV